MAEYPDHQDPWRDLARRSQQGDKTAYHQLLNDIAGFSKNYLVTRVANPDWAEDIVQEILISVHKSLHTYSTDRPFRPWLMAIVHFRKSDYLRQYYAARGDKQTPVEVLDFEKNVVTFSGHEGEWKDIEKALGSLPDKQRAIFEMVKIQGFTAKEVAEKMDMSVSAVKVSAHRSQQKLNKLLNE